MVGAVTYEDAGGSGTGGGRQVDFSPDLWFNLSVPAKNSPRFPPGNGGHGLASCALFFLL